MMNNTAFRLDRTAFQRLTIEEADAEMQSSANFSLPEKFDHFNYLVSVAYRFYGEDWPKMDKTSFEIRKRN